MTDSPKLSNYGPEELLVNVDVTHRCLLQCSKCARMEGPKGWWKRGSDITDESFEKICKFHENLWLCGAMGDPIYHPRFIKLLHIAWLNKNDITVSTNGHGKKDDFWSNAFYYDRVKWLFGVDGLPKDSHKYRKNQDGEAVFEIMKKGARMGNDITWQYIVFSYNENDIDEAKKIAYNEGIKFMIIESHRWLPDGDPLKPTKHFQEK